MADWEESVLDALSIGKSVAAACSIAGIETSTFYRRQAKDEAFAQRVTRARELQQDALVDEMQALADKATPEDWQVVRLQIWTRQWTAGKLRPRKYGDKIQTEHSGSVEVRSVRLKKELPAIKTDG